MILWGPAGTGKTTLARIVATAAGYVMEPVSAVTSGVKELREALGRARDRLGSDGRRTVLFIDEVHRFNKAQQDLLLPATESGEVVLIGATTENPFFEVNAALMSRTTLWRLSPLTDEELGVLIDRGLAVRGGAIDHDAREAVAASADGDARSALTTLDTALLLAGDGDRVTLAHVAQARDGRIYHQNADTHYDRNGNIVRPTPLGTVRPHDVRAYYLGWGGDGHIGRWNVSHQFYQAFGRDDFNGLAGRPVNINAQFAAVEVSYDRDWLRYKASFVYASGDSKADDGTAKGFDTILDNPNFVGGPFSYYVRQGFGLAGTAVGLKQGGSLVPNLRTSKAQGQANFVNPGVYLWGLGTDIDVTPKLKAFVNANYIRFAETDPLCTVLLTDKIDREIGWDLSLGVQYRPFLTDNVILSAGWGVLLPGRGYRDIYRRSTDPVAGLEPTANAGKVDSFLYSGLVALTLTY